VSRETIPYSTTVLHLCRVLSGTHQRHYTRPLLNFRNRTVGASQVSRDLPAPTRHNLKIDGQLAMLHASHVINDIASVRFTCPAFSWNLDLLYSFHNYD